MSFNYSS